MILGVDPGGALAWLNEQGDLLAIEDMPSIVIKVGGKQRKRVAAPLLAALLRELGPVHAYIENVGPMKTDGVAGAFSFGKAAGIVEGVVAGLTVPYTPVTPPVWKRAFGLGADKGLIRARAAQLFPGFASQFARVKDDGRAEAALIALYGVQMRRCGAAAA